MSFICDRCHEQQPRGSKPVRVTVETRPKDYSARYHEGVLIDVGGSGTEVVCEESLCARYASRAESKFILPG